MLKKKNKKLRHVTSVGRTQIDSCLTSKGNKVYLQLKDMSKVHMNYILHGLNLIQKSYITTKVSGQHSEDK